MFKNRFNRVNAIWFAFMLCAAASTAQELQRSYNTDVAIHKGNPGDTTIIKQLIKRAKSFHTFTADSSLPLFKAALDLSERINYYDGIAASLLGLGRCYWDKSNYKYASALFQKAIAPAQKSQDKALLIYAYDHIAVSSAFHGEYPLAMYYDYKLLTELAINPAIKFHSIVDVYSNISALWSTLKDTEMAITFLRRGEAIALYERDSVGLGQIYANLGATYFDDNKPLAYAYDLKALQYPNNRTRISVYNNLGEYHIEQRHRDSALYYFKKAMLLSKQINSYENEISTNYYMGVAYYQLNDFKNAAFYLLAAIDKMEHSDIKHNIIDAYSILADVFEKEKKYEQAYRQKQLYIQLYKQQMNEQSWQMLRKEEIKYKTLEKDKEIVAQKSNLEQKNSWIWGISTIALLLMGLLTSLYRSNRHKQQAHQKQIHILQQEQRIAQLRAIMEGEEKERARVARELHDGIGSKLATVKMNFSVLQHQYEPLLPPTEDFNDILDLLNDTCSEVRETAHNLMPAILIHHGLSAALKMYCDTINNASQVYISLQIHGNLEQLDQSFSLSIYRIVQELLQNIIKHAHASHTLVQLNRRDNIVSLLVEDNGTGFAADENQGTGLGMQNIQFRVAVLHGDISIQAEADKGTLVYIKFDLDKFNNPTAL